MKKSAQYQAALEILEKVFESKYPADGIINEYVRARKYIGSKDRKSIVETVWGVIRNRFKLGFDCKSDKPRDLLLTMLKDEDFDVLCAGGNYGLAPLDNKEKQMLKTLSEDVYPDYIEAETPKFLFEKINNVELAKSLNRTAPADFRINCSDRDELIKSLKKEGLFFSKTPYSPIGIRSEERINLNNCIAYNEGKMEVQDEASQLVAIMCDVNPRQKIIDYCAGAGGKSLTLAYLLGGEGMVYSHDINKQRLKPLPERAKRLGLFNIEIKNEIQDTDFERFIVDAPCSGSGVWRRSPDTKFRLNQKKIDELNHAQKDVLNFSAEHVAVGGEIAYITCSVLPEENEKIVEWFLLNHQEFCTINLKERWQDKVSLKYPFSRSDMLNFSPLITNTDGFFLCIFKKK